jgi:hypothetical protein
MIRSLPLRQPSGPGIGTGALHTYDRFRGRLAEQPAGARIGSNQDPAIPLVVEPVGPALLVVQDLLHG